MSIYRSGCQVDRFPDIGASRLVEGLKSALRRSAGGISRWHRRRSAIRELQALSDRDLADIGLDRCRIVSAVEAITEARGRAA